MLGAAPGVAKADHHPDQDIRDPRLASLLGQPQTVSPFGSVNGNTVYLSGSKTVYITPPGGANGPADAQFSSNDYYNVPCCFNDELQFSGSAEGDWYGTSPYNASSIALAETYEVTGLSISVTYPGGLGFSGSGSTANWNGSLNNNWTIYHYFNGSPDFHGTFMWNAYEYATTNLHFGTAFYTIGAQDSVALP